MVFNEIEEPVQSALREEVISGSEAYRMARRRWQGGSVKLRGKMWYGRWRESTLLEDGSELRKQRNEPIGSLADFPTKKLAKRELLNRLQDINSLSYKPMQSASFAVFAKKWKEAIMVNHKSSAIASETSIIDVHLEPRWGTVRLKEMESNPEAFQAWASSLKVAPKTQRNIVGLMRQMLDIAIEWNYIRYNPLARVRLKPKGLVDEFALSLEQIRKVINAAQEPYKTMYWILGETAIRAGEVLALGFEYIDLEHKLIKIRRKVWKGKMETVKSRKGVRNIAISDQLAEHLKEFANDRKAGLLFPGKDEQTPITYDHAVYEEFQPLLEKLEITTKPGQDCGFHAFRHGNATLMDQLGTPGKTRMDRLGHEKLDTTLDYTHAVSADDRLVAAKLGEMLTETVQ